MFQHFTRTQGSTISPGPRVAPFHQDAGFHHFTRTQGCTISPACTSHQGPVASDGAAVLGDPQEYHRQLRRQCVHQAVPCWGGGRGGGVRVSLACRPALMIRSRAPHAQLVPQPGQGGTQLNTSPTFPHRRGVWRGRRGGAPGEGGRGGGEEHLGMVRGIPTWPRLLNTQLRLHARGLQCHQGHHHPSPGGVSPWRCR